MKKKFLSILLTLALCLTLLPTAALADGSTKPSFGGDGSGTTDTGGGPTINPTCDHALGTDGTCTKCSKKLIAEVTKTVEGGTAISYLADTGITKKEPGQEDNFDLIEAAFLNSSTTAVKLLDDVKTTWGGSATITFGYPDQTLDLNGYTLDTNGGSIGLSYSYGDNPPTPSVTITDSSADKGGELKARVNIDVGTLTINSGKLTALAALEVASLASLYAAPQDTGLTPGSITIEGGSMTISGTAKVSCSTITVKGSESNRPSSLTVQDSAEITGGITVNQNGTLTMTGGTVKMQPHEPEAPLNSSDFLYVTGGTVKISGGAIDYLNVNSGSVELSGGTYKGVSAYSGSAVDLLKNGYAYFAKESAESTDYTKLTKPTTSDSVSMVQNVAVKPHECTFVQDDGAERTKYTCDCGRTTMQLPVAYVDENGNTAYCTEYTEITSSNSINLSADGWYVLPSTPSNIEVDSLTVNSNVHLILRQDTNLTVKGKLNVNASKSLTTYDQPRTYGGDPGKVKINGNASDGGGIVAQGDLTINGGEITVNTSAKLNASNGFINGVYSVAAANKLTVNGGKLTVTAPGHTNVESSVYGVYAGELTVNGGSLTVTSGDITSTNKQVSSCGIFTRKLTMTDGEVSASGAAIEVTRNNYTGSNPPSGSSTGISVEGDEDGTGIATITGGTLTATGGNATTIGGAGSMDAWSKGLYASELLVNGATATVNATGGNATVTVTGNPDGNLMARSYGINAGMTLKSGTVTAKSGTATGSDSVEAENWDLIGKLNMQDGTVTDGTAGSVLANLNTLTMTGGTLKLKENSELTSVAASPLNRPLMDGYAYYEVNRQRNDTTWTTTETNVGFVTLGNQTALNSGMDYSTVYYVKPCTHSATSGTCAYCGKNFGEAPSEPSSGYYMPWLGILTEKKPAAPEFVDVTVKDWFYEAVRWAAEQSITGGIDENHFGPELSCTRAQLVTFLWRAAGCPAMRDAQWFEDVPTGQWYSDAIAWAAHNGIVDGYGNGLFGTNDTITREQFVTILYRFAKNAGMDVSIGADTNILSYADALEVSEYAVEAFEWAVGAGIVQGYNGKLMPGQPCTRAQIVTMLYRLLGK